MKTVDFKQKEDIVRITREGLKSSINYFFKELRFVALK